MKKYTVEYCKNNDIGIIFYSPEEKRSILEYIKINKLYPIYKNDVNEYLKSGYDKGFLSFNGNRVYQNLKRESKNLISFKQFIKDNTKQQQFKTYI